MPLSSARLRRFRESQLIKNAAWISGAQLLSYGVQAVYFILLARLLGSGEYGVLAGAVTFVSLLSQYSALGSGAVFLRYVSIDPGRAPAYCGNVILSMLGFGSLLIWCVVLLAPHVIGSASARIVLVVAISDCLFRQISTTAGQIFQAFERMKMMAVLTSITNVVRLLAVFGLLSIRHQATAREWVWVSAIVSGVAAAACIVVVLVQVRHVSFSWLLFRERVREGCGFAFAASTNSVYNDVDKTMLSHYGMDAANGIYTTAYRLIDMATTPIWSLYQSALPRMFRAGTQGVRSTLSVSKKLMYSGVATGAVAGALCYASASLLPLLVGKSFGGSTSAVRWLALLPVFRAFALSAGAGLTSSGHQNFRTYVQVAAALFNFGVNLYLIPRYSWLGAAWASLATDAFMGCGNWLAYLYLCGKAGTAAPTEDDLVMAQLQGRV